MSSRLYKRRIIFATSSPEELSSTEHNLVKECSSRITSHATSKLRSFLLINQSLNDAQSVTTTPKRLNTMGITIYNVNRPLTTLLSHCDRFVGSIVSMAVTRVSKLFGRVNNKWQMMSVSSIVAPIDFKSLIFLSKHKKCLFISSPSS